MVVSDAEFRKLVEVIPALQTSRETTERAIAFGKACKKGW